MPIGIYPPILKSTQPAFLYTVSSYRVYFTLQQISSYNEIGHAQIRVVKQSNNKSIVNTSYYPDGIIYTDAIIAGNGANEYFVAINRNDLSLPWEANEMYKIQVRFGLNKKFTSVKNFATWKQTQINQSAFSEWSTVMVVKAINAPDIYIKNSERKQDVVSTEKTEATVTPLFSGYCSFDDGSAGKVEIVDKFRFSLYQGDSIDTEFLLETSGWKQRNSLTNSLDQYRFKTVLTNTETYSVTYEIMTVNGYTATTEPYTFIVSQYYLAELDKVTLRAEDNSAYCIDNGCVNLYLTNSIPLSGSFIISRSSEQSNYAVWEDLAYLIFNKKLADNELIYQDFVIESGVKYKYALQQENSAGLRTAPIYMEDDKIPKCVNFEYSFLYHNGVQLRLQFNHRMSSFKHSVLSSKQDTLGGKYPHITRNGQAYYAEFPISGLISLHMDSDQTFFTMQSDGYWFGGEKIISADKYLDIADNNTFNHDLTENNVYIERRFREKVEEFLNNFDYKLYKSPTEGNFVVVLTNVSLTPNTTLGRMIFDFSATAYEVMEDTLENLNEFGLIDIGQFEYLSSDEISYSFGQISGLFESGQELYNLIKQQEEISIGGGYKFNIRKISSLWIENYPRADFSSRIYELEALIASLKASGESYDKEQAELDELNNITQILAARPQLVGTTLLINNKEISMMPNRLYALDDLEEFVTSIKLKYKQPIIINYTCQLTQREDETVGVVSTIDSSRIWGQVSGIFTGTDKILKSYDYNYKINSIYQVFDPRGEETLINLYRTTNLFDIVKDETKKQIESIYRIQGGFPNYDEATDTWDNGTIYYTFSDMTKFDIEADPGTILYIGKNKDGSDKVEVVIGPTGRYTLNPMESLVRFVALKEPQFAIIDYQCLTNQMEMMKQGG